MTKFNSVILLPLCITAITGCSLLVPDYERPKVDTPEWRGAKSSKEAIPEQWWKKFGSNELNELTYKALNNNTNIQASVARIKQARAGVRGANAEFYPKIGFNSSGSRVHTDYPHFAKSAIQESYDAGASISYEVDLFGRNYNNSDVADERLTGTKFDHEALKIIISAQVAKAYAQVLSTADRLYIAEQNLKIENNVMRIIQARYDAGRIAGLELAQERTALANTKSNIASLIQLQDTQLSQLAVLTGVPPQNFKIKAETLAGFKIPSISPIQPSELLERRPDIRSSESSLIAANISVGSARAAYFPSLNLALGRNVSASPITVPAIATTNFGIGIAQTIFDGGAINANVNASHSRVRELSASYRGVILGAFQEVQDALAAVKGADARTMNLQEAVTQAKKAYEIAHAQYVNGSIDFQSLLDAQRSLFSAQDAFTQTQYDRISSSIDLYKALGGGWRERD